MIAFPARSEMSGRTLSALAIATIALATSAVARSDVAKPAAPVAGAISTSAGDKSQSAPGKASIGKLPIGIQAWSEHVAIDADPAAGYRALAKHGLGSIELYGTDGPSWKAIPEHLKANRLTAVSALIGLQPLIDDPKEMMRRARTLGLRYLGVAWIKMDSAPKNGLNVAEADRAIAAFNAACPAARAAGITQILHLHGNELGAAPSGTGTMLDYILAKVPARCLSVEMDVYWVRHQGGDPIALLRKLKSRIALLHLKDPSADMPVDDTGAVAVGYERALGEGTEDWPTLLAEARKQGVQYAFLEDETGDPATNIPKSVAYLRRIGALR